MKENKIIGITCLGISIIFSFLAWILKIWGHEFLENLTLDIASGAILSMITAIIIYFIQKNERITELKAEIRESLEKYITILDPFEYIYFDEKLEKEMKELGLYESNKRWKEGFVKSNQGLEKSNKKRLANLKRLNDIEYLSKKIEEISKLDKKINFDKFEVTKNKIKEINQNVIFMNFDKINEEKYYKNIQDIMFECRDEKGEKTNKDIKNKNGDVYPTDKINVILEEFNNIEMKMI